MKKNLIYSSVVFLMVLGFSASRLLTEAAMGVFEWDQLQFTLGFTVFIGLTLSGIFLFFLSVIKERFGSRAKNEVPYKPGKIFYSIAIILILSSSVYGGIQSYSMIKKEQGHKEQVERAAERREKEARSILEAERKRLAALTPEQRAAEEKQNKERIIAEAKIVAPIVPAFTRDQVIEARRKFKIKVISFDATQEFGVEFPYSDFVRLKITNGSKITISNLTVLTKRLDGNGRMIGSSRAPSIAVADLKPGQSAEVDYYPRGHLPGVNKITVEIEALIAPDAEKFFPELP